jgi:hypothetical protein
MTSLTEHYHEIIAREKRSNPVCLCRELHGFASLCAFGGLLAMLSGYHPPELRFAALPAVWYLGACVGTCLGNSDIVDAFTLPIFSRPMAMHAHNPGDFQPAIGSIYRMKFQGEPVYDALVLGTEGCWARVRIERPLPGKHQHLYNAGDEYTVKVAMYEFEDVT